MKAWKAYVKRPDGKIGRVTVHAHTLPQALRLLKHGGVTFIRWA